MSTAQFTIPLIQVIAGQLITASLWNNEYNSLFTNLNPSGVGAYSDTDAQMQIVTDPYPGSSTSRPTSLAGEIERLRFTILGITGKTYWYQPPDFTISGLNAKFPVQTADIGDLQVTTAKIAAAAVDENKIAASVAGNGLTGGAGSALAVNTDGSTLEINSDAVRVKDAGITSAKLASSLAIATLNVSTTLQFAGFNLLKILQIVQSTQNTAANYNSSSFVDTAITVSITPKINTSQILILAFFTSGQAAGDTGFFTIARNSTNLGGSNGLARILANNEDAMSLGYLDSPATISAITYKIQYKNVSASGSNNVPSATNTTAIIMAIEIGQ